ncbi:MAG TPA: hypothetical protein VGK27_06400 [Candidatus Deferrimicrobiaceae bacterium]|jgi:DNA polymerase-3 subunit alpha
MSIESVIGRLPAEGAVLLSADAIPFDDPATYRLFSAGDTAGIPRFDHEDALDYLRRLDPVRFAHLVAFQALYRMSTLTAGLLDRYIDRRHGRERSDCEVPALTPYFAETHGLPLYEEQLARIGTEVARFTPDDAVRFARAYSRYDEPAMFAVAVRFSEGASANGISGSAAKEMLDFLRRTGAFTLPETRLAGFATEGYRLAWLKAHYRDAFEAARCAAESALAPSLA